MEKHFIRFYIQQKIQRIYNLTVVTFRTLKIVKKVSKVSRKISVFYTLIKFI